MRWTVHRDETGTVTVSWRGTSGSEFPWGRVVDEEYLRYEVHDDRPAQACAHGEARTEVHLDGRLLVMSSTLDLDGDGTSLRYRLPPRAARGRPRHPRAHLGAPLPPRPLVTQRGTSAGGRVGARPGAAGARTRSMIAVNEGAPYGS